MVRSSQQGLWVCVGPKCLEAAQQYGTLKCRVAIASPVIRPSSLWGLGRLDQGLLSSSSMGEFAAKMSSGLPLLYCICSHLIQLYFLSLKKHKHILNPKLI